MSENNEVKELIAQSKAIKSEIMGIKSKLDEVNSIKEEWYSKKESFSKEIVGLIGKIKEFRALRDKLTNNVRTSKDRRTGMNTLINDKIAEIKKLQKDRSDKVGSDVSSVNPFAMKKELESLQYRLETTPMNFNAEQALMKKVNSIKKTLSGFEGVSDLNTTIKSLSKDIDKLKKEADDVHKTVQDDAKESQAKHEEMIQFSKKIDELKVSEETAYKTFMTHKEEFTGINNQLKEKLKDLAKVNKELDKHHIETGAKRKKKADAVLKEKQVSVEEKIQKGHKLTTDDLLAFQKMNK